jgi:hypothetical protein
MVKAATLNWCKDKLCLGYLPVEQVTRKMHKVDFYFQLSTRPTEC